MGGDGEKSVIKMRLLIAVVWMPLWGTRPVNKIKDAEGQRNNNNSWWLRIDNKFETNGLRD